MALVEDTFISHLVELRNRLVRTLIAIAVAFAVIAYWPTFGVIYDFLALPLIKTLPAGSKMIATGVITPFLIPLKVGLLIYGLSPANTAFSGGKLCIAPPIKRSPGLNSAGNPPGSGNDCSGILSMDFNAYLQSGAVPALQVVGQQVNAQYWSRDPGDPFGTNTSDAVQFKICQ